MELLIWADNLFLVGASLEELQTRAVGFEFSDSSLDCLEIPHVSKDASEGLTLRRTGQRFSMVASLRVSGFVLNAEGSTDAMLVHRVHEAWEALHRHRDFMTSLCRGASERVARLHQAVGAVAL